MFTRTIGKMVLVLVAAFGATAGSAVLATGTAGAAPATLTRAIASPSVSSASTTSSSAAVYNCSPGVCFAHVFAGAKLWFRSGGSFLLPPNDTVEITCWYTGASSSTDPYWDHVVSINDGTVHLVGHVWDGWVNFNGIEAPFLPGHPLGHC